MTLAIHDWARLDGTGRARLLDRPVHQDASLEESVAAIIGEVRRRGDAAVAEYTRRFDGVRIDTTRVEVEEWQLAESVLTSAAKSAIERSIGNVRHFHLAQRSPPVDVEIAVGVRCERRARPIAAVGLYVPAGSAPLPSAAIMTAVPAEIAGCPRRVLVTPPRVDGRADPTVLAAARRCGITEAYKIGGAQAIAALAYGTQTVPKVDKIFGPGNAYVAAAKLAVSRDPAGAAQDLPAGASEVLVIADASARATFVAADLLAQAEHDPGAHVLLLTTSLLLAEAVVAEITRQQPALTRRSITALALASCRIIVVADLAAAIGISNAYAPEHLILAVERPRDWIEKVTTAGSVFLGHWTPETIGDYCSGTNHVLPTAGYARAYSGLSLADFERQMTIQELTPAGLRDLGPVAITLAGLEGLDAHAAAVEVRLRALEAMP